VCACVRASPSMCSGQPAHVFGPARACFQASPRMSPHTRRRPQKSALFTCTQTKSLDTKCNVPRVRLTRALISSIETNCSLQLAFSRVLHVWLIKTFRSSRYSQCILFHQPSVTASIFSQSTVSTTFLHVPLLLPSLSLESSPRRSEPCISSVLPAVLASYCPSQVPCHIFKPLVSPYAIQKSSLRSWQ
jgi:hypothetical protein